MALFFEYKDSAFALACFLGVFLLMLTILSEPGKTKERLSKATALAILSAAALRFDLNMLTF